MVGSCSICQQLAEDLRFQRIQRIVFVEDVLGQGGVAPDERIERVAEHALSNGRHPRNVNQLLDWRVSGVLTRRLGNVDREIANPFQVGVDLDGRDNRSQVDGHRLVKRKQCETAIIDLDVQTVQRSVAGDHTVDQRAVAFDQTPHREPDLFFGQAAHFEQARFELLEFLLKMPDALLFRSHTV